MITQMRARRLGLPALPGGLADFSVYHYCPSLNQVREIKRQGAIHDNR